MRQINYQKRLTGFLAGRKCVFCGSRKVCITKRRYAKCLRCLKQKSLRRLRFEIEVIIAFVHQRPACQVAVEYGISYQPIHNIFRTIREILFHQTELEGKKLSGQIEIDEAYFGGRKKGNIGRRAWSKSVVFGLLERDGRAYARAVDNLTAPNLMEIIKKKTRKGSVYFADQFRSCSSLRQFGKRLTVNHGKAFSTKRHNHINGIEGFWPYAKHELYSYRGASKVNFPLYLKEMEYRFNHRKENIFETIMKLYFGYYSY